MRNESLASIRKHHPRAYEKWTTEDEELLTQGQREGAGVERLATLLQRQPGAVSSRLNKLQFAAERKSHGIADGSGVVLHWEVVLGASGEPYMFPNAPTAFMKRLYRGPTIYRWLLESEGGDQAPLVYLGETVRLCPDRLTGYLNPGPTQLTNIRLNRLLHECVTHGGRATLQILKLTGPLLSDLSLNNADLHRQDVRRSLESLLVTIYRSRGVNLLNL